MTVKTDDGLPVSHFADLVAIPTEGRSADLPEQAVSEDAFIEPVVNPGTEQFLVSDPQVKSAIGSGSGQSFQFRDTPLDIVLDQVLGEGFKSSFVIDPDVSARMSMRLENISTERDAVAALNAALAGRNLSLQRVGGAYVVSRDVNSSRPSADRAQIIAGEEMVTAETAILQLRYADPLTLQDLVGPLLAPDTIKSIDVSRGLLTLQGSRRDVAAAVDLLRAFDVDWFQATSSALIPLQAASASEVKSELDEILGRDGGFEAVALNRLNAVMVFARTAALLDRAQGLIVQLDRRAHRPDAGNMLLYRARYISPKRLEAMALAMVEATPPPLAPLAESKRPAAPLPRASFAIAMDEASGLLAVSGEADDLARIQQLFTELDVPQDQVLIEVTVVEVTLRDEFRFGVQWSGLDGLVDFTFVDNDTGDLTSRFPGVSIAYANTDIGAVLNVLDNETDIEIVSSPRVLALNNETAAITVGAEVPIITQSAVSVTDPGAPIVNSTQYRDTGIILEVTPRVRAGGLVEIALSQEVSDVAETTTPGIDSPTFSQRQLDSVLAVPDGATLALGGLFSSNRTESHIGVPVLSDVPLFGRLFSSTTDTVRRTELVVLVRPQIVRSTMSDLDLTQNLRDALVRFRSSLEPAA